VQYWEGMSSGGVMAIACVVLLGSACIQPRGHHEPAPPPPGVAPGSVALGDPCGSFEACAAVAGKSVGCRCTDHAAVPLCVTDAEVGAPCANPAPVPCRPGLVCAQAAAGADFVCTALGEVGDTCDLGGCADDLYCDPTGRCAVPAAGPGEPCGAPDAWSCRAPAVCHLQTSTCIEPIPVGAPCASSIGGRSECGRGAFCTLARADTDARCEAQKGDGEQCYVDEECLSWVCFSGFCGRGYPASVIASCGH